jgi:predicted nucleic acid-binding protein
MEIASRRWPAVSLVLDCSVALAWIDGDETVPAVARVFDKVADNGAVVPSLRRLEVATTQTIAAQRRRIDVEFRRAALADLARLNIAIDPETDLRAWPATLERADTFRLTACDAAYLELAQPRGLPLATRGSEPRASGDKLGISVLGGP